MPVDDDDNKQTTPDYNPPLVWCGLCGYMVTRLCQDWDSCPRMKIRSTP